MDILVDNKFHDLRQVDFGKYRSVSYLLAHRLLWQSVMVSDEQRRIDKGVDKGI